MEEKKEACWKAGVLVRIVRLTNASHHNGKIGRVSARAGPNGRIGNVYCMAITFTWFLEFPKSSLLRC